MERLREIKEALSELWLVWCLVGVWVGFLRHDMARFWASRQFLDYRLGRKGMGL